MAPSETIHRGLKTRVENLLTSDDFPGALDRITALPGRRVINPLLSLLLHPDELVRWKAVTAIGAVVDSAERNNREDARIIMRRLMWTLNDESGGIGWGAPESMGEIMARNEALAEEYAPILLSYLDEEGNFLEYEPLQRGLIWGLLRAATVRPDLFKDAAYFVPKYLDSGDSTVRGLAAWAVGVLGIVEMKEKLRSLCSDESPLRLYQEAGIEECTVGDLARRGLGVLE